MRVLVDTDVILDMLLARPEFVKEAAAIWKAKADDKFEGYISAITPVNVFYIARKLKGADTAREAVGLLLAAWHVCPVNESVLKAALSLPFKDFEDAVQHAGGAALQIDFIVTRNVDDYKQAKISVLPPPHFWKSWVDSGLSVMFGHVPSRILRPCPNRATSGRDDSALSGRYGHVPRNRPLRHPVRK